MSFDKNKIREGGVYVKSDGFAARIVDVILFERVFYRSFYLRAGTLDDAGVCAMATMRNWIGREATPEEHSKLDLAGTDEDPRTRQDRVIKIFIDQANDQELEDEIRQRSKTVDRTTSRENYEKLLAEVRRRGITKFDR